MFNATEIEAMSTGDRERVAGKLVEKAERHEAEAEALDKQITELTEAKRRKADRAYYLRRMAHAITHIDAPTEQFKPF